MSSTDAQNRFINEALAAHNEYRSLHSASPLVHNPELSKIAHNWAITIARKNKLEHSTNKYNNEPIGENLAMWFMTDANHYDGRQATEQWYDEVKDYKFNKPEFNFKTGHFTQVVWRDSKEVGFGVAIAPNGYFYAVANYYPAGNYTNQFEENVLPASSSGKNEHTKKKVQETREKPVVVKQPSVQDKEKNNNNRETDEKPAKEKSGCC